MKLYYSTCCKLAYIINERFYKREHFVWCSPVHDPKLLAQTDLHYDIPDSSSPKKIYEVLKNDIASDDQHSEKIKTLKAGLKKAMNIKLEAEVINQNDAQIILKMIERATLKDFAPRLMIIPMTDNLGKRLMKVPVEEAANPLSIEYQIADLRSDEFEIIMY